MHCGRYRGHLCASQIDMVAVQVSQKQLHLQTDLDRMHVRRGPPCREILGELFPRVTPNKKGALKVKTYIPNWTHDLDA